MIHVLIIKMDLLINRPQPTTTIVKTSIWVYAFGFRANVVCFAIFSAASIILASFVVDPSSILAAEIALPVVSTVTSIAIFNVSEISTPVCT